jgi:hypothetical protein
MMLGDTANEKRWVIIATEWGGDALHGQFIPPQNRPTIFQPSREVAEAELARLEQRFGRKFALFESVVYAQMTGGPQRSSDPADTPRAFVVYPIDPNR